MLCVAVDNRHTCRAFDGLSKLLSDIELVHCILVFSVASLCTMTMHGRGPCWHALICFLMTTVVKLLFRLLKLVSWFLHLYVFLHNGLCALMCRDAFDTLHPVMAHMRSVHLCTYCSSRIQE
jgi:hypothetical protein